MASCKVDECNRASRCNGMCKMHWNRWYRHGDPNIVLKSKGPPRKRTLVGSSGYRMLYNPEHPNASKNGYIGEHRFVMSEVLGRPLYKGENVHHKNGRKLDNSPENLELWITYQPAGQRPEDLVEWAHEILKRYAI